MLIWTESGLYFKCFAFKNLKTEAGLTGLKVVRFSRKSLKLKIVSDMNSTSVTLGKSLVLSALFYKDEDYNGFLRLLVCISTTK